MVNGYENEKWIKMSLTMMAYEIPFKQVWSDDANASIRAAAAPRSILLTQNMRKSMLITNIYSLLSKYSLPNK